MNFVTKKVQTETLGEYLVACRQHARLTSNEAAKLAQVQLKFLLALEMGRYEELPAAVYVRGFLRSLARLYRADVTRLLNQFAAEHEIACNLKIVSAPEPRRRFIMPRFIFSPKSLVIGIVALVGLLSFGYLYFQVATLKRPPALMVFEPTGDGVVNSSLLVVRGHTEPGASVYFNNQPIVSDAAGNFQEDLSLGPGENQIEIRALNKFGQETKVTRSVFLQQKQIAGSFTSSSTPETTGLTLEVAMGNESAWISLTADGVEKYSGTMLPNSRQIVSAQNKIVLTTGNAGATRVFLNGKDLGIVGKEGEVIRDIEFTP